MASRLASGSGKSYVRANGESMESGRMYVGHSECRIVQFPLAWSTAEVIM